MATEVNKILLELEVDAKGVVKNLDQVQSKLKGVGVSAENVGKQFSNFSKSAKQGADSAGIAGAAAAELGRTISDLPFGINAVTNNISQLGSMFSLLVVRTGSVREAMKSLLAVFKGPAGALIIFQIAVAAVEFFSQAQRKAKKDIDATTESFDVQAAAVKNLIGSFEISNLISQLDMLNKSEEDTADAAKELEKRLRDVVTFLISKSPEFKEAFESLTPDEKNSVDVLKNLVKEYGNIINIRNNIKKLNKELEDKELTESKRAEIEAQIVDTELALMKRLQAFKTRMSKELDTDIDTFYDFGADAAEAVDQGFKDAMAEQAGAFLDPVPDLDPDAIPYVDIIAEEGEQALLQEIENNERRRREQERAAQERLNIEIATINALADIKMSEVDIIESVFRSIADITKQSRFIQALSLIGESAAGIAKIVIDTQAANMALRAAQSVAIGLGQKRRAFIMGLQIKANKIAAAAGIAANVGATATALSKLKAPVGGASSQSVGGGGEAAPVGSAPSFNVVGAAGQNQLAAAIAGTQQQPVKAYVVSSDVTTAQQLDRNIIQSASI